MAPHRYSLPKSHILRSKTDIDALVERGAVLFKYPIKAYWLERCAEGVAVSAGDPSAVPAFSRIMVSVPKRSFKRAVKRNLLKRRIREAWRLNASLLGGRHYDILFVYLGREIEGYERIQSSLTGILRTLADGHAD
jgi:ribonuclease P protein component